MVVGMILVALALGAPPQQGVLVPGESLGGLRPGASAAQVKAAWGARHGVCRTCARATWYFNYRPFEPQGLGVELRRGHASALFTLWQPTGWRTRQGLRLADPASRVTELYGDLPRVECAGYDALVLRRGRVRTVFYVHEDSVWGFGLLAARVPACRE